MIENDSHLSIVFDRIGCEIVTSDEYSRIIDNDHLSMEIGLSGNSPVPGWELCLTSPIGLIVCGTYFDFFVWGYETRDQSEQVLVIESLNIEDDTRLSREDEILDLRPSIERWHHDMRGNLRYILVPHMRGVGGEYILQESECSDISPSVDVFTIFGKKWRRPIPSRNRIRIIDDPELRMSERVAMIVCVDYWDIRFFEFFDYGSIDPRCAEHIALQYYPHIDSSLLCSDDCLSQFRSIRPSIYLDPDTILCSIDTRDEIPLRMRIREWLHLSIRNKHISWYDRFRRGEFDIFSPKMLMIRARTASGHEK